MPDLIALSDLQTITKLNGSVEARRVGNGIQDAHLEIEKVLGRTGYGIVYAAAPSFTTLSPNTAAYVTLLTDYIKPLMAWRAKQRSYPDLYAEADKAGVFSKSGEDYSTVDPKALAILIANDRDRADERLQRLIEHLEANTTVFTWYTTNVNGDPRITETKSTGGWSFRRARLQDPERG